MPKYIVKLTDSATGSDYYLEWSTIVDAPVTCGMSLEEFTDHYRREYGESSMRGEFQERMQRVAANGTSYRLGDVASVLRCNRAGENETELTQEQIIEEYCRNRPD